MNLQSGRVLTDISAAWKKERKKTPSFISMGPRRWYSRVLRFLPAKWLNGCLAAAGTLRFPSAVTRHSSNKADFWTYWKEWNWSPNHNDSSNKLPETELSFCTCRGHSYGEEVASDWLLLALWNAFDYCICHSCVQCSPLLTTLFLIDSKLHWKKLCRSSSACVSFKGGL